MFAVLNYITTPSTLWCIYPIYAVIWWPIGVFLCLKKRYLAFALAGSLTTLAFLAAVNFLTTPHNLWFFYTLPPLLCFPAGVYMRNKISVPIVVLFSLLLIVYYPIINLAFAPQRFWAIYPIFATLWWPLHLIFRNDYKKFSIAGALLTIVFFIASNMLETSYPWALYACFPVTLWPAAMYMGKRMGALRFSIFGCVSTILWYGALNILLAPGSPWVIFVAFAVLWWPLSVYYYGKHHRYALVMSALSIAFFTAVNLIYSPGAVWAIYPAFVLLWWPVTLMFTRSKMWRAYAVTASLMTVAFFAAVNLITSPSFPWSVFPSLCILWWPLAMFFKGKALPFAVAGASLVIATLLTINLITSPGFLWSVFVALCVLWWPVSVYFAQRKSAFGLSVAGSLLITALTAAINLMTSPGFLWSMFVVFGVLWWPLSVYFHGVRKKRLAV
jgi:hypothetical protein